MALRMNDLGGKIQPASEKFLSDCLKPYECTPEMSLKLREMYDGAIDFLTLKTCIALKKSTLLWNGIQPKAQTSASPTCSLGPISATYRTILRCRVARLLLNSSKRTYQGRAQEAPMSTPQTRCTTIQNSPKGIKWSAVPLPC